MRATLRYTLRLHDHIGSVTRTYFELRSPFPGRIQDEPDSQFYRAYLQELITNRAHYSDLTPDQKYLHDLGGLSSPVLSVYRSTLRLSRLKLRAGNIRASSRLEECCQQIAIECSNFKGRIKAFGNSAIEIITDTKIQRQTKSKIGKLVRSYDRTNERILKYRNFIVHGPKGREDEFADLRSWELGAILFHNDIWFDYNNAFEGVRSDWSLLARDLLTSMEGSIATIQLLNENLLSTRAFRFLQRA